MKKICFILFLLTTICGHAQNSSERKAYAIYDNKGKEISYGQLVNAISKYDVVFFGEHHNNPICHWLEYILLKDLYKTCNGKITVGMEMLEADDQLIVNEYINDLITAGRYESEAHLWDNYNPDYYRIVDFAKENKINVIASNVPRRYASAVSENGIDVLSKFSSEAKKFFPPLPLKIENDEETKSTLSMMSAMSNHKKDPQKMQQAQALKDATMAWFISKNLNGLFFHINGSYHTDNKKGIIPYLKQYAPKSSVVTITTATQENMLQPDMESYQDVADFYIFVPEDMSTTY